MKKFLRSLLLLIVILYSVSAFANESVTPADEMFTDITMEQAHALSQEILKEPYLYDGALYTCTATEQEDGAYVFDYCWKYLPTVIYSVTIPKNMDKAAAIATYNTDYGYDDYYSDLMALFGKMFGDWTVEQKAWMTSVAESHWELETYRQYCINPEWHPSSLFIERSLERERCGMPDENSISEEEATQIATQFIEETLPSGKSIWKTQRFYIINDPENPVWLVRVWFSVNMNENIEVTVNPYTKEIIRIKRWE